MENTIKQCCSCKEHKSILGFAVDRTKRDGHKYKCKECESVSRKAARIQDPERYKSYRWSNEKRREYWHRTKAQRNKYQREWAAKNKDKVAAYARKSRLSSLHSKLMSNLRGRINYALHQESLTRKSSTPTLLGCSIEKLKAHLESKFQPGMSWDNYGRGLGCWHIDHIRPCALFDLSNPKEQLECFNYKNLRPLWAKDNLSLAVRAKSFKRRNGRMKQVELL